MRVVTIKPIATNDDIVYMTDHILQTNIALSYTLGTTEYQMLNHLSDVKRNVAKVKRPVIFDNDDINENFFWHVKAITLF